MQRGLRRPRYTETISRPRIPQLRQIGLAHEVRECHKSNDLQSPLEDRRNLSSLDHDGRTNIVTHRRGQRAQVVLSWVP